MKSIGIDIGSTATKVAVVEDDQVVDTLLMPTGFSSVDAAERVASALAERSFDLEAVPVVATGYGRIAVPYATKTVTEITCHGRGAQYLFGAEGTVIDVGGQDTKIIQLSGGKVKKFVMNDKCSAGTGKFLEVMADRMGVSQQRLAELARLGRVDRHIEHVHGVRRIRGHFACGQRRTAREHRQRGHRVRGGAHLCARGTDARRHVLPDRGFM